MASMSIGTSGRKTTIYKKFKNETFEYYHEYFHHITDHWQNKHGLKTAELGREYESIWRKEDQGVDGYMGFLGN